MTLRRRDDHHLSIEGLAVERRYELDDLRLLPGLEEDRFDVPAVPVAGLLDRLEVDARADHATALSGDGHYSASIPVTELRRGGWLLLGQEVGSGGPVRLVVEDGRTLCWNVKQVVGLRFTDGAEPDSVPENPPH
ncbi:MAG: hypothetical protein R3290_04085 [Acidimicrobiia bacterium]|nr:hypothetical protein [Acidimicrobiia bacterium]